MRWYGALTAAVLTGAIGLAGAFTVGPLAAVTTNGISMQPRISAGDLVIVGPASSYDVGDSAAYYSPMLDTVVLHRIVAVDGDHYVFQGDNNSWLDPEKPMVDDIVGKELLHIPQGGIWLERLTSPQALAAYTFLLLAGGAAAATTKRQRRKERRTVSPRHRARPTTATAGLPPALRPVAAAVGALAVTGAALGGLSWTRPMLTTTTAESEATSTMDFSYTATVPESAAYDGTTVTAPQPVFRALTDVVDVSYRYTGAPGTIAVAAELSTASGWSSTVPLSPEQPLSSEQDGTVRLELSALEARAAAAAAVTGIPAGSLTVTLAPTITLDDGGEFAPTMAMSLDERALRPSGELTAESAGTVTGTREVPATLSALGRQLDVTTARKASLVALLAAALGAAALAAVARLAGPVAEAERIRARHKALLLPVLPIALAPGRPVVDVPTMDALATLAERYGLLVLHWSRSGVDTYVVQDEGTTYRYRSGTGVSTQAEVQPVG